jgi:hypothetical protein
MSAAVRWQQQTLLFCPLVVNLEVITNYPGLWMIEGLHIEINVKKRA